MLSLPIYDGLGVSQDLTFCELNPDGYDHIVVGDKRVDFPKGRENLTERLKSHFPHEAKGIDSYFATLTYTIDSFKRLGVLSNPTKSAVGAMSVFKWMRATDADLINTHVSDPVLRGVLAGQAGDHGLPPSRVSALMHASITHYYLNGGYYLLGGAFTLPRAFVKAWKCSSGASTLSHGVAGVTQSGINAAKAVLNCRTRDLLKQNGASLTFLPSEDVSQWPEYLRRKMERGEVAREELTPV